MKEAKSSLLHKEPETLGLMERADHKTLAIWARDCAQRALPFFEEKFPNDFRPRNALLALQNWIDTGEFSMAVIRKASLDSHAAARDVGDDVPARSAARACGQAVATAHVKTHSIGAATYTLQAIYRETSSMEDVEKEREWQNNHLSELIDKSWEASIN